MGFRFRKSINLGGGFRVNLSKSGVGYSWGVKGFRATRTAKGRRRTTASIPGTGISFVSEGGGRRKRSDRASSTPSGTPEVDTNHYDAVSIENAVAANIVSGGLEELLDAANYALKVRRWFNIALWIMLALSFLFLPLFLLAGVLLLVKLVVLSKLRIDIDYTIEPDFVADDRVSFMGRVSTCSAVWRIMQTSKVVDRKYSAGASESVNLVPCTVVDKLPFPFKADAKVVGFKSKKETLLFMPDKLFLIQGNTVGVLSYSDLKSETSKTRFVERGVVPKDTLVVDRTWSRVNKSGGPDRRFKDNREIPICLYGEIHLWSETGLNTIFMYSNPNA